MKTVKYSFLAFLCLLYFSSCHVIPIGISGDTQEYVYRTLNGTWNSLNGKIQYQFSSVSNFVILTNGVNYVKGFYGLSLSDYGFDFMNDTGGMYFMETAVYTGGSWSNIAQLEIMPYVIYDKGGSFAVNVFNKYDGDMVNGSRDGKYSYMYGIEVVTNLSLSWTWGNSDDTNIFFTSTRNIFTISGNSLDFSFNNILNFTNNNNNYFFIRFDHSWQLNAYDVNVNNAVWTANLLQYSREITNYHVLLGNIGETSGTNNNVQQFGVYLKSIPGKGAFLIIASDYSNNIFKR